MGSVLSFGVINLLADVGYEGPHPITWLIWPGSTRAQASLHFATAYTLVSWRCLLHR